MFTTIKFLTGSRAKSRFCYRNGSFKLVWMSPSSAPLHLEDFERVEYVAPGFLNFMALVKCTFKNGEEAMATVSYLMLEALSTFIKS